MSIEIGGRDRYGVNFKKTTILSELISMAQLILKMKTIQNMFVHNNLLSYPPNKMVLGAYPFTLLRIMVSCEQTMKH